MSIHILLINFSYDNYFLNYIEFTFLQNTKLRTAIWLKSNNDLETMTFILYF